MKTQLFLFTLLLSCTLAYSQNDKVIEKLNNNNVIWNSPSKGSEGSMPLGNGDIGLNVWVEEGGDLMFYISKTDAFSGIGRLLKLGRIRVKLTPNPFLKGQKFKQELDLKNGEILIMAGNNPIKIRLWVDANNPVIRIDAESKKKFAIESKLELWRNEKTYLDKDAGSARGLTNQKEKDYYPLLVEPDVILPSTDNSISWYHRNGVSCYPVTLSNQHLSEFLPKHKDPLINRTFGATMLGDKFKATDNKTLVSKKKDNKFSISIYPLTAQPETVSDWQHQINENISNDKKIDKGLALQKHREWWDDFWHRSWIFVDNDADSDTVNSGYALQRFMNACAGRGNLPFKFNGSIFNYDLFNVESKGFKGLDADFRQWGGCYWFQNTRLIYWPLLASGDFDLMIPWFDMYLNALPLAKDICKKYYGHEGAMFPETMYFWGTYSNCDFGWDNPRYITDNPYIRYYWDGGLELIAVMLDYYDITKDEKFAQKYLLPLSDEIIKFFAIHWPKKRGSNKIQFYPAMSLETWHEATNPTPVIAGMKYILPRLINLPLVSSSQKQEWENILETVPEIPVKEENGKKYILPAEVYSTLANSENPELYPVFPYKFFGKNKPELNMALNTWEKRRVKIYGCWIQNPLQASLLGLTDEAKDMVVEVFKIKDPNARFPAFWGPRNDWTPDMDNGGVGMLTLQSMLMQCDGDKIYLLPSWPKEWDVDFKLHAPGNTIVEAKLKAGKIIELKVSPEERKNDIEIPQIFKVEKL